MPEFLRSLGHDSVRTGPQWRGIFIDARIEDGEEWAAANVRRNGGASL